MTGRVTCARTWSLSCPWLLYTCTAPPVATRLFLTPLKAHCNLQLYAWHTLAPILGSASLPPANARSASPLCRISCAEIEGRVISNDLFR